jgi:hypothetical protein
MSMKDIIRTYQSIHKAKNYASLKVFRSVPATRIPPANQTFYLRLKTGGTVYEIGRDTMTGTLLIDQPDKAVQIRSYIAWDEDQLWCFVSNSNGQGLLFHPKSSHYLSVENNQLKWKFNHDEANQADFFEYTSQGHWVHVRTGYKLSYTTGCGMGAGHDEVSVRYDFDVVPAYDVMSALNANRIYWSNTNNSETL